MLVCYVLYACSRLCVDGWLIDMMSVGRENSVLCCAMLGGLYIAVSNGNGIDIGI